MGLLASGVATGEDPHQRPDYGPTERESSLDMPDVVKSLKLGVTWSLLV